MITITRSLARQLRRMFRRACFTGRSARRPVPALFSASSAGLSIRALSYHAAIEYRLPGSFESEQIALPIEALEACEGTRNDPVTLENVAGDRVCLRWDHRGMPHAQEYDDCRGKILEAWPVLPEKFTSTDCVILTALQRAMDTTDRNPSRSATDAVLLQGRTGKIMATDCHQALVCSQGFSFPWDDDLLLSHSDVFGFDEFPDDDNLAMGATASHLCFQIGPWNLFLNRVKEGRFPDVEGACPFPDAIATRAHIPAEDRAFLRTTLPELPAREEWNSPITLDCNGQFVIRAKGPDDAVLTELVLSRSQVTGKPARFNINR